MRKGEIRDSQIRELLEKVRRRNYGSYLRSIFLKRIRHFAGATINFDFPVTALVGPNGSGKSTVLAAAACAYTTANAKDFFFTSVVGDEQAFSWELEYEVVDRSLSASDAVRVYAKITRETIELSPKASRPIKYFGINRTLHPVTSPFFMRKYFRFSESKSRQAVREQKEVDTEFVRQEASRVLGKELSSFRLYDVWFTVRKLVKQKRLKQKLDGTIEPVDNAGNRVWVVRHVPKTQTLFVAEGKHKYSEFNFGAGEASVLRLIHGIEQLPEQALLLIEEIENGLHPLAVERLTEYLISAASRKKIQVVFTTHSEYALRPLPSEAIWSTLEGRLIQGSLSVESLRALSGRVDKKLAIFVEDYFAQKWVEAILREGLQERFDEVGVYFVNGDDAAVKIHIAHNSNPALGFRSLCLIDGDSKQAEHEEKGVFRLPGESPELLVFNNVRENVEKNAAILTAACQRPLSAQKSVVDAVEEVSTTNRDPHLLFAQIGERIGLVSEEIVRGAFLSVWIQENPDLVQQISDMVKKALG